MIPDFIRDLPLIPVDGATKSPHVGGQNWASRRYTPAGLDTLLRDHPSWGLGVLLGEYVDVEIDAPDDVRLIYAESILEPLVVPTLTWQSARGVHRLYRLTPEQRGSLTQSIVKHEDIEFRLGGTGRALQSVIPPAGGRVWLEEIEPAILPDALFDFICAKQKSVAPAVERTEPREGDELADQFTWSQILEPLGWRILRNNGETIQWTRPGKRTGVSATTGFCEVGRADDVFYSFSTSDEVAPLPVNVSVSKFEAIAFTRHDGDFVSAVSALRDGLLDVGEMFSGVEEGSTEEFEPEPEQDTPKETKAPYEFSKRLTDNVLGRFAHYLSDGDFTEASPDAIYISLLTMVGNFLGGRVHIRDYGGQSTRLYSILVGPPGTGRKGTAGAEAAAVARIGGPTSEFTEWYLNKVERSASSGEGIINKLANEQSDPRLLLWIEEADGLFAAMGREGNTLSAVIREGYDGNPLSILTRKDPKRADHNQLGALVMTTTDGFRVASTHTNEQSGLLSRFLVYGCLRRKVLSTPRRHAEADDRRRELCEWIDLAYRNHEGRHEYSLDDAAARRFADYTRMSSDYVDDFDSNRRSVAQMARINNHVLRVALILAAIDPENTLLRVGLEHIEQAIEVANGHEAVVNHFVATGDNDLRDTIKTAIIDKSKVGMTLTDIYTLSRSVKRGVKSQEVREILDGLTAKGLVRKVVTQQVGKGRPGTRYYPQ